MKQVGTAVVRSHTNRSSMNVLPALEEFLKRIASLVTTANDLYITIGDSTDSPKTRRKIRKADGLVEAAFRKLESACLAIHFYASFDGSDWNADQWVSYVLEDCKGGPLEQQRWLSQITAAKIENGNKLVAEAVSGLEQAKQFLRECGID